MEMEFSRLEKVVGTFVIGVVLLLMATLVIIGRGKDWFEKYITYYTTFNESYNLQENAAVKLFKADIGKVKKITLAKNRVRVKLAILEKYASRIREDAVAVVESPTLIGSEYISIIPGSTDAPLIAESGEIPSREKRSLADILTEFEVEKTAKMVVKAIQDISEAAHKLSDTEGSLWRSLDNIEKISAHVEQITADLEAGKGPLGALFKSEALLKKIENNLQRMDQTLDNLNLATAKAPEILDTYRDAGQAAKARVQEAKKILDDIHHATGNLKIILDNVKAGSYNVPRISTTFRDGIQEIREGVEQINRIVNSLQKNVFIRPNLPPEPSPQNTDAGVRPR